MRDQFIQLIRLKSSDSKDVQRFLSNFEELGSKECWLWEGARNSLEEELGAGRFYLRRSPDVSISAPRVQWERCVGPLDKYSRITLDCGNKHCVNTSHMRVRGRGYSYTSKEPQWPKN